VAGTDEAMMGNSWVGSTGRRGNRETEIYIKISGKQKISQGNAEAEREYFGFMRGMMMMMMMDDDLFFALPLKKMRNERTTTG